MAASIGNLNVGHTTALASTDTVALNAAAGSAGIVTVAMNTKTRTLTSVTDSAGNSGWVVFDGGGGSGEGNIWIAWNPNLTSAITTITFHYSGTTKVTWTTMEVTGLAGTVQAHGLDHHTVAATTGASALTTTGDVFIVGAAGAPSTTISSVDAPFTLQESDSGSGIGSGMAAVEETSNGTYTATFHYAASVGSTTVIAAFDVAGGASPATIILGEATSTPQAFGPTLVPGAKTLTLGEATSSPSAFGLTLAPGARTITLGEAVSTAAAFGLDVHSVITMHLGVASSTPQAFGLSVTPGGVVLPMGLASSVPTAFGPTLVPGARTLNLGEAVSTPASFGINVRSVSVIPLGIATSTPNALGVDLSPGRATLVLGVAASVPVARGLTVVPGARTITLGEAVSIAQAFGLHLSLLIPASPYPDPRNQIQVVFSANNAPMSPAINQIQLGTSRNFMQLNPSINSIIAIEEA